MNAVLVTGPRGLLGATLMRRLAEVGIETVPFDGDIAQREDVMRHAARLGPDAWIVHTVAMTDVVRCEREREACFRTHVDGTRNIRDLAAAAGARLLTVSTVSVFDGMAGGYKEDDLPYPKNWYNVTKYLGEIVAGEYARSTIVRLNLIGIHPDGSRGKNFLEWLDDSARTGKDIKLFNDVRINPVSARTAADRIIDLMRLPDSPRIIHLGTRDRASKAEIGRMILARYPAYAGRVQEISVDAASPKIERPKEMWLDVSYAESLGLASSTIAEEIETSYV